MEAMSSVLTTADVDLLFGHAVTMRKRGHEDLPEAFADLAARIAGTIPGGDDGTYVRKAWEVVKGQSLAKPAGRLSAL